MTRKGDRGARRHAWLLGPAAALVLFGGPTLLLDRVVEGAKECFASIPERREAGLPDCAAREGWISPLERWPFIGRPSLRAHEEIEARMAVWRYLDATVGEPDAQARRDRLAALWDVRRAIGDGSGRQRLDEVGPPMPLPDPGMLAFGAGDRAALDENGARFADPFNETRALEAILLEGRTDRAVELARHYADYATGDAQVRVAALLCSGGDGEAGMAHILGLERTRAGERSANFARHFGELRVVIEACAALMHEEPPGVPPYGYAGTWDQRPRLAVMRVEQIREGDTACVFSRLDGCRDRVGAASRIEDVRELLRGDHAAHRLALFASIADAFPASDTARTLRVGAAAAWLPSFPEEWLATTPDAPFVPAERYESAAARLDDEAGARALRVRAAIAFAQRADLAAADRCLAAASLPAAVLPRLRAEAALVAGDRDAARERARGEDPALVLLRAELALPDAERAASLARQALLAGDPAVVERARWLLMSLGVTTRGAEVVDPGALALPPRYRFANEATLLDPAVRATNLDEALGAWHAWLASDNPRQARYALFASRGDAPGAFATYLYAASRLASAAQAEVWLDAAMALDARRFSLRQVAFARWQAAAWRGDDAAAATWRARYQTLARMAQDPARAELWQALRIWKSEFTHPYPPPSETLAVSKHRFLVNPLRAGRSCQDAARNGGMRPPSLAISPQFGKDGVLVARAVGSYSAAPPNIISRPDPM